MEFLEQILLIICAIYSKVKSVTWNWQTLIGSLIGAITPIFILWYSDARKEKKETRDYLYYLQRIIVDQINAVIDMEITINKFLDIQIKTLLKNIDANPGQAYSVDTIFLPLFSVRSIPDDVHHQSSGSGYIDNKIGKVYSISKDFPHIIEDIRQQLKQTLENNEKIAFGKLNSANIQKQQYKRNIQEFEKMTREQLLGINIPIYLKLLAEALIPLRAKIETRPFVWKFKFQPSFLNFI